VTTNAGDVTVDAAAEVEAPAPGTVASDIDALSFDDALGELQRTVAALETGGLSARAYDRAVRARRGAPRALHDPARRCGAPDPPARGRPGGSPRSSTRKARRGGPCERSLTDVGDPPDPPRPRGAARPHGRAARGPRAGDPRDDHRDRAITGGHLGSSLGVVELAIALHRLLESPRDRIVWDTGHQAYPHKLLTGRYATFGTLRQLGAWAASRVARSRARRVDGGHAGTGLSIGEASRGTGHPALARSRGGRGG